MAESDEDAVSASLRYHLDRIIGDMQRRRYPPLYFMRAINWTDADDDELLERCKGLLRNPVGQSAADDYKRRFHDGLTLEDVVISHGASLGFEAEDIAIARRTLGV